MPIKDNERRRAYRRAWYARTKDTLHQRESRRVRRRRQRANRGRKNAELVRAIKAERGCLVCGERDPVVLAFHHRDPEQKSFVLCGGAIDLRSTKQILAEVAKCDVLCANCHADLHFKNRKRNIPSLPRKRTLTIVERFLRGDFGDLDT